MVCFSCRKVVVPTTPSREPSTPDTTEIKETAYCGYCRTTYEITTVRVKGPLGPVADAEARRRESD